MKKCVACILAFLLFVATFPEILEVLTVRVNAAGGYLCTINYYLMNKDMSTYSLFETAEDIVEPDSEYVPALMEYIGFISPKEKHVVIDNDKTINYFYDRETYTIKYVADDSSAVPEPQTKIFDVDLDITKIKPERSGYSFVGWTDEKESSKVKYYTESTIMTNENITLYAVWSRKYKIIYFDANGGSSCNSNIYFNGCTMGKLPVTQKPGYNFDGWYYDDEFKSKVSEDDIVDSTKDFVLFAKWTKRKITKLSIISLPVKTEYFVGEDNDVNGLELYAEYDNGESATIKKDFEIDKTTFDSSGVCSVTVSYEGLNCTYDVYVNIVEIEWLKITKLPDLTTYYVDDKLNSAGMELTVGYNNGKTEIIYGNYLAEYNFSETGSKIVNVSYTDAGKTVCDSFEVNVIQKPEVYTENINAQKNDIIAVPVYIKNNNGLMGYNILLQYDTKALLPVSTEVAGIFSAGIFDDNIGFATNSELNVVWTGTEKVVQDGLMFTAYFKVMDVKSADYPVKVTYVSENTINDTYGEVPLNCSNGIVTVNNDNYVATASIYSENIYSEAGKTVQVPIYVENISTVENIGVIVSYSENLLQPLDIIQINGNGTIISDDTKTFISVKNVNTDISDELLMIIEFSVGELASGDYSIGITSDKAIGTEINLNVESSSKQFAADIYIKNVNAGDYLVTVPFYVKNNPGLMGYKIGIQYDTQVLSVASVSCGNDFSTGMFAYSDTNGEIVAVWNSTKDVKQDGILFTVTFEKNEPVGIDTILTTNWFPDDTYNENWESVYLNLSDVKVNSEKTAYGNGDVNSDGVIDLKDIMLIKRYLAGGYNDYIYQEYADVNQDKKINIIDLMITERYFYGGYSNVDEWFM